MKLILNYMAWLAFTVAAITTGFKLLWLLWVPPNLLDIPICLGIALLWFFWAQFKNKGVETNVELVVENNISDAMKSVVQEAVVKEREECLSDCMSIVNRIKNGHYKSNKEMIQAIESCMNQISMRE